MPGKYDQYDNVYDFTEYKLASIVKELADMGEISSANIFQEALDNYMVGDVDIGWHEGQPYVMGTQYIREEDPNDYE